MFREKGVKNQNESVLITVEIVEKQTWEYFKVVSKRKASTWTLMTPVTCPTPYIISKPVPRSQISPSQQYGPVCVKEGVVVSSVEHCGSLIMDAVGLRLSGWGGWDGTGRGLPLTLTCLCIVLFTGEVAQNAHAAFCARKCSFIHTGQHVNVHILGGRTE